MASATLKRLARDDDAHTAATNDDPTVTACDDATTSVHANTASIHADRHAMDGHDATTRIHAVDAGTACAKRVRPAAWLLRDQCCKRCKWSMDVCTKHQ